MKLNKPETTFFFGTDLIDASFYKYKNGRMKLMIETMEYPDGLLLSFNRYGKLRIFDDNDCEIDIKVKK